ncbi:tail protein (tape measure) [Salmonella enterica subsp. enterica serovar Reading]|nr:tail protein (tape measure) [Salmonella enterica subsp. enterica serovar Eko]EBK5512910.1 tail protein (tape measure) [Salmonella enterica]EDP0600507.1 tail protein (tape measure) [Salmonella enterica subsp. enterica serovar Reading]EED8141976.1 tail protein (tape measure) [Salmonella enterica subsp. enterica]EDP1179962.1 tail protein (tape measure) [Salmonella enterica subsp. enterica serovar Reading]
MSEIVGDIEYVIKANTDALLKGNKQVDKYLSQLQSSFDSADKAAGGLEGSLKQTGSAIDDTSNAAAAMSRNVAAVEGAVGKLNTNINSLTRAILESRSGVSSANSEFSRAESIIESLGNQLAILEEQQEGSARSAAILAAQLRAGSNATEEEKKTIADLTGRLYDMKSGTEAGAKGTKNWKSTMQQAGYQVNDFIVQVQGGQSALVAFSQQGSQLAGALGPGGAVIGAVLALSTVVAGAFITSLNGGKNAMDALKSAAETMDKVITISQNGVAALSDKYAALAQTNIAVATLMKKQAELELQAALSSVSKEVKRASSDFISFGDSLISSLGGGYASVKLFNDYLSTLNITTNDFSEAWKQAAASGQAGQSTMNSMVATVAALSTKFDISDQKAFEFAKQLSDIAKTPTDEKLRALVVTLQDVGNGQSSGSAKAREYAKSLLTIMETSTDATSRLKALKEMTDSLTSSQDKALKIAQQELFIARQNGEAQMKAKAWRDAEAQGLKEGTEAFRKYYNVKLATYKQDEANANSKKGASSAASEAKKLANQQETVAQKLENLRQQSDLAADSTKELSREQAVLAAQQSLGKGATQEQIALAGKYRGEIWDTANALKAQAAAEKLLPEARENASYKQDVEDLKTALAAKKISQEQFNETSLRIEQQHQANLAKIRAQQAVTPQQSAIGEIDPVQQLANQHAQELALIQQFETQKGQITQRGLELMNAANTQYEQARIAAQWEIYRNQSTTNQLMADAVDSLQGGATNAITGLINGTQSLQESLANIGTTILNSVVGGFVQMGVEWVKSQLMGQAAAATSLASTMAQATAAASAWAPAAMSASIATYGSAAAIGQAAFAESMVAAKGLALAGGRRYGGTVSAGNAYRINENGRSEIFQTAGGKQIFMPNQSGKIIPADKAGGGGGVVQHITFEINTTGGIDDATMAKMAQMMKQVTLFHINDQASRPGGLIQPRNKR